VAAPPTSIEWNRLSPPSLEAVKLITMRMAAGYSYDEVALMLDTEQPELRRLKPPTDSRFTTQWVSKGTASFAPRSSSPARRRTRRPG
jgi:hypothetical protein